MAISKININGVEHELQTTIDNITNLQPSLDKKLDKTGGTLTGSIHVSSEDSDTVVSIDNGEVKFDNGSFDPPTSVNQSGAYFAGGGSTIVLDGFGESGKRIALSVPEDNAIIYFEDESGDACGVIRGLIDASSDDQAVPYGQVKDLIKDAKNELLGTEQLQGTYDTLKEIGHWIETSGVDATDLSEAIAAEARTRAEEDAKKLDKEGYDPLTISKSDEEVDSTFETVIDGQTISFNDMDAGYESSIDIHGAYFQGGTSAIVLDGHGDSGYKATLTVDDEASLKFEDENGDDCGVVSGLIDATQNNQAVPYGQMKEYAMPKYNEGILTYQDDPEFEGKTYCVDIPDLTELKVGMELTIIPHVTSVITGPSLSINGGEKVGMRVTASTTNSSFNGTRPDFMNAGAPVKLMYIERNTVANAAYAVLSSGQVVTMNEPGTWANGCYIVLSDDGATISLFDSDGVELDMFNPEEGVIEYQYFTIDCDNLGVDGTYYFSNGTDEASTRLWRIMNSVRVNAEALMSNNAMGGGMYACTPGKANEKLLWNTPAQVGMDINKNSVFAAASTNGTVYTVNEVPNLTSLYRGLELTILPSRSSASTSTTLNVNGLGAKQIRCRGTGTSGGSYNPKKTDFITANKPTKVKYDGTYWLIDLVHVNAETLFGQVPISNGGTGASSASGARTALSVPSLAQFNALLARVEALEAGGSGTITFYINTGDEEISYRAEEGMTWSQFINSSYNESIECPSCGGEVSNFERDGTYIHFNLAQSGCLMEARENDDYSYVLSTGGDYIELSDVIIDNTTYEIGFP